MPWMRLIMSNWLPVVLWMLLIYVGSTDTLSTHHTNRWLVPVIKWFKPDITYRELATTTYAIRKAGHVTEYAILAMLLWRAIPRQAGGHGTVWLWRDALVVLAVCASYAVSDEYHQSFYRSREASAWDVLIDVGGVVLSLALMWWLCRRRVLRQRRLEKLKVALAGKLTMPSLMRAR